MTFTVEQMIGAAFQHGYDAKSLDALLGYCRAVLTGAGPMTYGTDDAAEICVAAIDGYLAQNREQVTNR